MALKFKSIIKISNLNLLIWIVFITLISCNSNTSTDSILIDKSKEEALEHYTKAKNYIDTKDFIKSYGHIVKARSSLKSKVNLV